MHLYNNAPCKFLSERLKDRLALVRNRGCHGHIVSVTVELFFEVQTSDVVEKGFDAGIRLSDILAKDVVALKLFGPVRFVTAASPEYLSKMGRPKHPEDLLSHNCIR
jgi:hypothetical protein